MLNASDIRYFIDPLNDPTQQRTDSNEKRILVTEEQRDYYRAQATSDPFVCGDMVGRVVEPTGYQFNGERFWYVHSGNYVDGPVLKPQVRSTQRAIGILDDGTFVLGTPDTASTTCFIHHYQRSDQRSASFGNPENIQVDKWVLAADWAPQLFPAHTDDDETVALKLEVAKQKWKLRKAHAEVIRQADYRSWKSPMDELRENVNLPAPKYGSFVTASVGIPVRDPSWEVPTSTRNQLDELRTKTGQALRQVGTTVNVRAEFPCPSLRYDTRDEALNPSHDEVIIAARHMLGDHGVIVSSFQSNPILCDLG